MSLPGHQGEIWGLAVSGDGEFVVTTSQDRSIRIWERTTEQIFIEEEREGELEKIFEASLEDDQPSLQEVRIPSQPIEFYSDLTRSVGRS